MIILLSAGIQKVTRVGASRENDLLLFPIFMTLSLMVLTSLKLLMIERSAPWAARTAKQLSALLMEPGVLCHYVVYFTPSLVGWCHRETEIGLEQSTSIDWAARTPRIKTF